MKYTYNFSIRFQLVEHSCVFFFFFSLPYKTYSISFTTITNKNRNLYFQKNIHLFDELKKIGGKNGNCFEKV